MTRNYPFVPGIDAAGTISDANSSNFVEGDEVLVTGYDMGMNTPGGFGEFINVPANWVVKKPSALTSIEAMSIGTAGLTAAASVLKIFEFAQESDLPVLVSGATGGVGSVAVGVLSLLGYEVHAITSKVDEEKFLLKMGASKVLIKDNFMKEPTKPLDKGLYGGAVDVVASVLEINREDK